MSHAKPTRPTLLLHAAKTGDQPSSGGGEIREPLQALAAIIRRVKNPHAVALGRLGGLRGGRRGGLARAANLTASRRRQIARAAARARWGVPATFASLFPGYAFEDIVLPEQIDLVMLHLLTRGGPEHRRWLVGRFGVRTIRSWIAAREGRGLTLAQLRRWVSESTARNWIAADPYAKLWEDR